MNHNLPTFFLPMHVVSAEEVRDFIIRAENLMRERQAIELFHKIEEDSFQERESVLYKQSLKIQNAQDEDKLVTNNLYVFVSFSLPLANWSELSYDLEKLGGNFVLKGLPSNSFQIFSEKIIELRNTGIMAPIQINPDLYAKYKVEAIPSIVLEGPLSYDKVTGNMKLRTSLELFAQRGSADELAKSLLKKLAVSS